MSCNGACGPLTKTEGTYRGRVADNSADVSEKEDLLRCPAMAPVGRSPRLKAPTGGELLTIQQKEDLLMCPAMAPVGHSPRLKAPTGGQFSTQWSAIEKEDLLRCPAMVPVGHSPRLKAPTGGELLTIQQMLVRKRTY